MHSDLLLPLTVYNHYDYSLEGGTIATPSAIMSSINELAALRHLEAQMTESFQRLYSAYDTLPSNTTADLAHAQQELVKVAQRVVEAVQGPVIHALHLAFLVGAILFIFSFVPN